MLTDIMVQDFFQPSKEYPEKDLGIFLMTKNTIILCNNSESVHKIADIVHSIMTGKADEEGNIHYKMSCFSNKDSIKVECMYQPTAIFKVGKQKIIITVDPMAILSMKNKNDLIFFEGNEIYYFVNFKGYEEVWKRGAFAVFGDYVGCRYGTYDGYKGE